MISYRPFYETMRARGLTEYALIFKHGVSGHTLQRMREGRNMSTATLNTLCTILNCRIEDIIEFKMDGE